MTILHVIHTDYLFYVFVNCIVVILVNFLDFLYSLPFFPKFSQIVLLGCPAHKSIQNQSLKNLTKTDQLMKKEMLTTFEVYLLILQ